MITGLLSFVIGISVFASFRNGETGSAVIGLLLIYLLLSFRRALRDDSLAYAHRVQYWKMNGRDRAKARIRWEREAEEEERRERSARRTPERTGPVPEEAAEVPEKTHEERMAELREKQEAYENRRKLEMLRMMRMEGVLMVCRNCCRYVKSEQTAFWIGKDGEMKYRCPRCGAENSITRRM